MFRKALPYALRPGPWSLATPLPAKTDKAKLLHIMEDDTGHENIMQLEDKVYIINGNAPLQAVTGLPQTFPEHLQKSILFPAKGKDNTLCV